MPPTHGGYKRDWLNGRASAFQAEHEGSTPSPRSTDIQAAAAGSPGPRPSIPPPRAPTELTFGAAAASLTRQREADTGSRPTTQRRAMRGRSTTVRSRAVFQTTKLCQEKHTIPADAGRERPPPARVLSHPSRRDSCTTSRRSQRTQGNGLPHTHPEAVPLSLCNGRSLPSWTHSTGQHLSSHKHQYKG